MRHTTTLSLAIAVLAPISNCASLIGDAGRLTTRDTDAATYPPSGYPDAVSSPPAVGSTTVPDFTASWDAAYAKAAAAVKKLSIPEKSILTTGGGFGASICSGTIHPIVTIGFKGLCLEDGPMAMRPAEKTTVFPAGINAAASFNRGLIRSRAVAMGSEFKAKGVNVAFMPAVNMHRTPEGGRGWEAFGAEPFLAGVAGYETVLGLQSTGVQANAKHLVANEQEYQRFTSDSIITDRVLHEVYMHPFLMTMVAGVSSLMCSLNRVNGDFACGNNAVQNTIVRKLYGYRGYILSDWLAAHGTSDALNGLEVTMPGNAGVNSVPLSSVIISPNGESFFGPNITAGVVAGTFPVARLNEMATRVLAGYYRLKQDSNNVVPDYTREVRTSSNTKVARDLAAASIVLLKNINNALPLSKSKLTSGMAVLGSDARLPTVLNGALGAVNDGTMFFGWGSGSGTLSSAASAPADALTVQAKADKTAIVTNFDDWNVNSAAASAKGKSAAIVFVKTMSGEGHIVPPVEFAADGVNPGDRLNISAWNNGDNLIKAVAAVNKNTIVVVHAVGQMDVEGWIENPNITAVVWAGVPGQESGNALVDVLYGKVNPSGRLPYTIAKKFSDYPAPTSRVGGHNDRVAINYTEGLLIDYRHFDSKNITPRFAFGFGLSYTTFSYSSISVTKGIQPFGADSDSASDSESDSASTSTSTPPASSIALNWMKGKTASGDGVATQTWMHTKVLTVSFTLKNTGKVAGTEIPQLYLSFPSGSGEPPRVLRGFDNIFLGAGESKKVSIPLTPMMLSIWDSTGQGWKRPSGTFSVSVGPNSRDLKLTATVPALS